MSVADAHRLLRSQQASIHWAIELLDLDPAEFKWETARITIEVEHYDEYFGDVTHQEVIDVPALRHLPSGFHCKFAPDFVSFSPGSESWVDDIRTRTWKERSAAAMKWLDNLKREIETPDYWASGLKGPDVADVANAEDRPFTEAEREAKRTDVETAGQYVLDQEELKEHVAAIQQKLDYVKAAIDRMSRRDWIHTALGAVVSIGAACGLSPKVARDLWDIVSQGFRSVLKLRG